MVDRFYLRRACSGDSQHIGGGALLRFLSHFALTLAFFTRLPVPAFLFNHSASLRDAFWTVPLVGGVLGGVLALVLSGLAWAGLPESVTVIFVMVIGVILTGALHEDGLADFCDGLGGANQEKALAIMKDSQIGSFGCLGLGFSVVARVLMLLELMRLGAGPLALLVMHVGGRGCLCWLLFFPLARGSGAAFETLGLPHSVSFYSTGFIVVLSLFLSVGVLFYWLSVLQMFALLSVGSLVVLAVGLIALRRFGGVTGDVFGAAEQAAEIVLLAVLLCVLS